MTDLQVQRGPRSIWEHIVQSLGRIRKAVGRVVERGWRWLESWRWKHRAEQYASSPERSLKEIQKLEGWAYGRILNGYGKQGAQLLQTLCKHHPHKANQPVVEQVGWFHILAHWGNVWSKTLLTAQQGPPGAGGVAPPERARDTLTMLQKQPETWEYLFRTLVLARTHLETQNFDIHGSILLMASRQPGTRRDPRLKQLLMEVGGVGVLQNLARHAQGEEFRQLLFRLLRAGPGGAEVATQLLKEAATEQVRGLGKQDFQNLLQVDYEPLRQAALLGLARLPTQPDATVH